MSIKANQILFCQDSRNLAKDSKQKDRALSKFVKNFLKPFSRSPVGQSGRGLDYRAPVVFLVNL